MEIIPEKSEAAFFPTETGKEPTSKWRTFVMLMCTFGFTNLMAMRVDMSFSMVCMVNQTAIGSQTDKLNVSSSNLTVCEGGEQEPQSAPDDGDFVWSKHTQGLILSSFFWGYLWLQLPGGLFSVRFGGHKLVAVSMTVGALLTFLTPLCASWSPWALLANRVAQGLAQGLFMPGFLMILSQWSPPDERTRITAVAFSGQYVSNIVVSPLSALLCTYISWEYVFHLFGFITVTWLVLWSFLVTDSPRTHRFISVAEKMHILRSLDGTETKTTVKDVPWKSLMSSVVFWAVIVGHLGYDWGNFLLLTNLPTFYREVFHLNITSNGLFVSLPYVAAAMAASFGGWAADVAIVRGFLSKVNVRRLTHFSGTVMSSLLFLAASHVGCSVSTAVTLIIIGQGLSGLAMCSFVVSLVEIAPRYSDVLSGVSNSIATLSGVVAPAIVSLLTVDQTVDQWQVVFYTSVAIQTLSSAVYGCFVQCSVQPWARGTDGTRSDYCNGHLGGPSGENTAAELEQLKPKCTELDTAL